MWSREALGRHLASLEAAIYEQDVDHNRPAWVEIELTTGKGMGTTVKIQPFEGNGVWVPYWRGAVVSRAYIVKQGPFMVAARMIVHRIQGVGFKRVAVWIPLGFFAQGQGYTTLSTNFLERGDITLPAHLLMNCLLSTCESTRTVTVHCTTPRCVKQTIKCCVPEVSLFGRPVLKGLTKCDGFFHVKCAFLG